MQVKKIFDPEKITILQFTLQKGNIDAPENFSIDKVAGHHTKNDLQLGFNVEQKLIRADYQVEIKTESEGQNKKEAKGQFHFVYLIKVDNLEELAPLNKNQAAVELHSTLANAVASISYSTSRGILLTRLQGTALQKFILPVIDPMSLLKAEEKPKGGK